MNQQPKPTKERVRTYLGQRAAERKALPSIEEIRRQLGWDLKAKR